MANIGLALSTQVAPAKKFTVDGQEYQILVVDHLSVNDEAEVTALFSRFQWLLMELEQTPNLTKGKALAEGLRRTRLQIIGKLTDLPKNVREALPLGQQALLLEAIEAEIQSSRESPDSEDGPEEVTEEDENLSDFLGDQA